MSEIDKILDAINILQDFSLAQSGNIEALDKLKKRENLPEPLKVALQKFEPKPEPVVEKEVCPKCGKEPCVCEAEPEEYKKMTTRYGKPVREEYKTDEEFKKALDEYSAFVLDLTAEIRKAIETPIGEAIKKSLVPEKKPESDPVDVEKLFKNVGGAKDFADFMYKEGIVL